MEGETPDSGTGGPHVESLDGELRLVVDGAVQSVAIHGSETPHGYWRALVPGTPASHALVLGLGGGTVAHLLRRRSPELRLTGVDDDARVLDLARKTFHIDGAWVNTVQADAREFVRGCSERYDLVIVDLFRGETIAPVVAQRRFIRQVRSLVAQGGTLVWNLHRDRRSAALRRRTGLGLQLDRRVLAGLNLVLHYRRRRYRRIAHGDSPQGPKS